MEEQPKKEQIGVTLNSAEQKALEMIRRGGESARRGGALLSHIEAARRLLIKE